MPVVAGLVTFNNNVSRKKHNFTPHVEALVIVVGTCRLCGAEVVVLKSIFKHKRAGSFSVTMNSGNFEVIILGGGWCKAKLVARNPV